MSFKRVLTHPDYFVDKEGNVTRVGSGKFLHQNNTGRYSRVLMKSHGIWKYFYVHRLVAEAFIGNSQKPVNHKNGNRFDNRAVNLEYVTPKENQQHASRNGLLAIGSRHGNSVLTESEVLEIRRQCANGYTLSEIAEDFEIAFQTVSKIKNRHSWRHI